jgi:hypothetical protein
MFIKYSSSYGGIAKIFRRGLFSLLFLFLKNQPQTFSVLYEWLLEKTFLLIWCCSK